MKKFIALFALTLALSGCETKTTEPCPTPTAEPSASPSAVPTPVPTTEPTPTPVASPSPTPTPTPSPTPSPKPSPSPSPTASPTPTPLPASAYKPVSYQFPQARPFIKLADFTTPTDAAKTRFLAMTKRWAIDGVRTEYNYSAKLSVVAYALTGDERYIRSAIADTNAFVESQIAAACSGTQPTTAGDSYLYAGDFAEDVVLTYDWGFSLLTDTQKQRWSEYMKQTSSNIWNPAQAKWGGPQFGATCAATPRSWSGWALDNAGNNYFYRTHAKVPMLYYLMTQDEGTKTLLQAKIFPMIVKYYQDKVNDGGSREGTGYGTAQRTLFDDYRWWKAATNEDLSRYSQHARSTIDYWVHATMPTLDKFAPIGDQSRSSEPNLYDYHRDLVHQAILLNKGSDEAKRGQWFLDNIGVKQMQSGFNAVYDLLPYEATAQKPASTTYCAWGAGVCFARSSWDKTATHMTFVAGQFEESHAGQDQGGFTFYKNGWLAVTSNIWSSSGIKQSETNAARPGVVSSNVIRFERSDGRPIAQNQYKDVSAPQIVAAVVDQARYFTADLSAAYSSNNALVKSWRRQLAYAGNNLVVTDTCDVAAGVTPVWQLHVPVLPVKNADGSVTAGKLRIVAQSADSITFTEMRSLDAEYAAGRYRIDVKSSAGCAFNVLLEAL